MAIQQRKKLHVRILLGLTLICLAALFFVPAIPQPDAYHQFADNRTLLGIPNFLTVLSSLFFLAAGGYGLRLLFNSTHGSARAKFDTSSEAIPYAIFFAGAVLTCFGSVYYHLSPENFSLVWDRLPMSIMFAAFLAIVIAERLNLWAGIILLPFLILLGVFSVWLWYLSELMGSGDLRLYLAIQFLPIPLILYMIFFLPSRYSRGNRIGWVIGLYALAKIAELFDQEIFDLQYWISGHTLKHILAALAVVALAEMLRCRISLKRAQQTNRDLDNY